MAKRSTLADHHHLKLTSSPGNRLPSAYGASPLNVRTKLRERRPASVKRHTARIATRLVVLLLGDITAILLCQLLAAFAAQNAILGAGLAHQFSKALGAGYGAGVNFGVAVILALVITGN